MKIDPRDYESYDDFYEEEYPRKPKLHYNDVAKHRKGSDIRNKRLEKERWKDNESDKDIDSFNL
jgi:hypothetical protein